MSKKSTKSNYSVSEKMYGVSVAEYYTTFLHLVISLIRKTHKHHKCHLTLFKNQNTMFPRFVVRLFSYKIPPFIGFIYCDYTFKVVYYIMYSSLATKMTLAVFTKLQFLPDENIQDVAQISYVNKMR